MSNLNKAVNKVLCDSKGKKVLPYTTTETESVSVRLFFPRPSMLRKDSIKSGDEMINPVKALKEGLAVRGEDNPSFYMVLGTKEEYPDEEEEETED